jgi:hypothetical protein
VHLSPRVSQADIAFKHSMLLCSSCVSASSQVVINDPALPFSDAVLLVTAASVPGPQRQCKCVVPDCSWQKSFGTRNTRRRRVDGKMTRPKVTPLPIANSLLTAVWDHRCHHPATAARQQACFSTHS